MKNIFKKIITFALVLCFGVSLVACGDNSLSQKETEEYTAKVVESIDIAEGYSFSGVIKAVSTMKYGKQASEDVEQMEISGYVYASGNRLVDMTLLATAVQEVYDHPYNEETEEFEDVKMYEYKQVYFDDGSVYVRGARNATKNRTALNDAEWELQFTLPVYELENQENYDAELVVYNTGDEQMSQPNMMAIAMDLLADVANMEFDASDAIEFVVGALGEDIKGKWEGGNVALYNTHNYAKLVNSILGILARDAKDTTATIKTTINDIVAVLNEELKLGLEGDFTDLLIEGLEKVLYKEVVVDEQTGETEKVSNDIAGIVALIDELLEEKGVEVTVADLVNMIPADVLSEIGFEVGEGQTVYSVLMDNFGEITLESLFYQYVEPMIVDAISTNMGGSSDNEDVANYNTGNPEEHMIDYMNITTMIESLLQYPSSMVLGGFVSGYLDQNGKMMIDMKKLSYYVAVLADKSGEFAGFELKLEFGMTMGETAIEAKILINFDAEKIADKSVLEQVDVHNGVE